MGVTVKFKFKMVFVQWRIDMTDREVE